ncbi:MAG: hypothetical protein CMH46_10560 [Muricauda sp.]|jgi:hypothetical protein|nr:hypothetical protein [Allomuricauda sp.]MAU15965.1 hypothetical protein [Allomuricauda sp.]|tara:strand:- start:3827 stop:4405 length:579 start_codon:yes stop_codon:yes gene_type:complete
MTLDLKIKNLAILALMAVILTMGYLVLRTIFNSAAPDITFELYAAILGFTLTALVTFLLLNKQTDAELRKEESILFLNLKMSVYQELLRQLQDVITKKRISKEDIIELRLLNQRISFVASAEVLEAFNAFVKFFAHQTSRDSLDETIIDSLLDEMSKLAVYIRRDLFQIDKKELNVEELQRLILSSNDLLDS